MQVASMLQHINSRCRLLRRQVSYNALFRRLHADVYQSPKLCRVHTLPLTLPWGIAMLVALALVFA